MRTNTIDKPFLLEAPKEQEVKILQGYIDCPKCTEEQDECFTCMKQEC